MNRNGFDASYGSYVETRLIASLHSRSIQTTWDCSPSNDNFSFSQMPFHQIQSTHSAQMSSIGPSVETRFIASLHSRSIQTTWDYSPSNANFSFDQMPFGQIQSTHSAQMSSVAPSVETRLIASLHSRSIQTIWDCSPSNANFSFDQMPFHQMPFDRITSTNSALMSSVGPSVETRLIASLHSRSIQTTWDYSPSNTNFSFNQISSAGIVRFR